jgi:DNA polymerase I-like protein with 3'-5' exonuclease and polymerase domains
MTRLIAIDTETTLIGDPNFGRVPAYVVMSVSTNHGEPYLSLDVDNLFFKFLKEARDTDTELIFHNAGFDLGIFLWNHPEMKPLVIDLCAKKKIHDTMIREKLYDLSTSGDVETQKGSGRYSLAALGKKYLGNDRSADKGEDSWRMRYSELIGVPLAEWPEKASSYALEDASDTLEIFIRQEAIRESSGEGSMNTEGLQVAAALALSEMSFHGIKLDRDYFYKFKQATLIQSDPAKNRLVELGLAEYKSVTRRETKIVETFFRKKKKELVTHIKDNIPKYTKLTAKGNLSTSKADLEELKHDSKVGAWLDYLENEKLLTTYIPQLESAIKEGGIIYPGFKELVNTGRTSSFRQSNLPSTNIQQPPRKEGVRECLVPREGFVFARIDYGALELCSGAQSLYNLFGYSKLKDVLNEGDTPVDLHSWFGAKLLSDVLNETVTYKQFLKLLEKGDKQAKEFRTIAKPIDLSYMGGVGDNTVLSIANATYGLSLEIEHVKKYAKEFFDAFPEILRYRRQLDQLFRKGGKSKRGVRDAEPMYSYDVRGRHRARTSYAACANGYAMQSLAADGAKIALARCYARLPFKAVLFFHDEIMFEIPKNGEVINNIKLCAKEMLLGMKQVLPDVRINVEACVQERYSKEDKYVSQTVVYWVNEGKEAKEVLE